MEYVILLKTFIAAGLGAVIGFEREMSHKVAGLRTHTLVCMASALLTSLAIDGFIEYLGTTPYDPSRIVSNIIVGIGFIGAGAILRQGSRVQGTTTAASLWAVAAVGVTGGLGFFRGAAVVAAVIFLILRFLRATEEKIISKLRHMDGEEPDESTEE